jgi:hypothetical protein
MTQDRAKLAVIDAGRGDATIGSASQGMGRGILVEDKSTAKPTA